MAISPAQRRFSLYAWGVVVWNLFVIVWGAAVRATGSGAGCGSHWPLCNGEVVPRAPEIATIIEFTHRITSGLALLSVAALVYLAWKWFPKGHLARKASLISLIFYPTDDLPDLTVDLTAAFRRSDNDLIDLRL